MKNKQLFSLVLSTFLIVLKVGGQPQQWWHFYGDDLVYAAPAMNDKYVWMQFVGGVAKVNLDNPQEMTVYDAMNSDIPSQWITAMVTDETATQLWATHHEQGILHFDGTNWNHHTHTANGARLYYSDMPALVEDSTLWFYSRYEEYQWGIFTLTGGAITEVALPNSWHPASVLFMKSDSENNVWLVVRSSGNVISILKYDGQNWTTFSTPDWGVPLQSCSGFVADNHGGLYMLAFSANGLSDSGLFHYDGQNWTLIPFDNNYPVHEYINSSPQLAVSPDDHLWIPLNYNQNTALEFDGNSWIIHDLLSEFNLPENGRLQFIQTDHFDNYWIIYNYKLYRENEGDLEIIRPGNIDVSTSTFQNLFIDIHQNKIGETDGGFLKFDGLLWEFIPYEQGTNPVYLTYLFHDRQGNLWYHLPLLKQLVKFDGQNYHYINVPYYNNASYNGTSCIKIDRSDRIWVSYGEERLGWYDEEGWHFTPEASSWERLTSFHIDGSNRIWCVGFEEILKYDNNIWTVVASLPLSNLVDPYKIWIDSQERIWIDYTNGELSEIIPWAYVYENNTWNSFSQVFDIPSFINTLPMAITEDPSGNIWVGITASGLYKFDGQTWTHYHTLNSLLPSNNVYYLAADEEGNIWLSANGGLVVFNENGIQNIRSNPKFSISGKVFYDLNQNGERDPEDFPLPNQKVKASPNEIICFTNNSGTYTHYSNPGICNVAFQSYPEWVITSDSMSYQTVVDVLPDTVPDFLIVYQGNNGGIELQLAMATSRCNFIVPQWLQIENDHPLPISGLEVRILPDSLVDVVMTSPPYQAISGDTLIWYFSTLEPFLPISIQLDLQMPNESYSGVGTYYQAFAQGTILGVDEQVSAMTDFHAQITCAVDPNDKTAIPQGERSGAYSLVENPLDYLIRFQNTGNDTAFTVVIRDTLDSELDFSTFEILAHSHPMETRMDQNGVVTFIFEDIYLPDSMANEAASHGFVKYRVKAKQELALPLHIHNTAYIYFDFNAPIVTNTTSNFLTDVLVDVSNAPATNFDVQIMPNPATDDLWILMVELPEEPVRLTLYNLEGRIVRPSVSLGKTQMQSIQVNDLPAGMYLMSVECKREKVWKRFILMD